MFEFTGDLKFLHFKVLESIKEVIKQGHGNIFLLQKLIVETQRFQNGERNISYNRRPNGSLSSPLTDALFLTLLIYLGVKLDERLHFTGTWS